MIELEEYCKILASGLSERVKHGEITSREAEIIYFEDENRKLLFDAEVENEMTRASIKPMVVNSNRLVFICGQK